jgi:hypothetical protein
MEITIIIILFIHHPPKIIARTCIRTVLRYAGIFKKTSRLSSAGFKSAESICFLNRSNHVFNLGGVYILHATGIVGSSITTVNIAKPRERILLVSVFIG